ncbi:unnamed protein product [Rodentolepis nana]|uniref:Protein Wnt n=1 Tax=Rodentolepis nana TaxID=102285 RepID=A0A0R3T016_RODNA|nr:unnamed protein product [Rodentolepis nana]
MPLCCDWLGADQSTSARLKPHANAERKKRVGIKKSASTNMQVPPRKCSIWIVWIALFLCLLQVEFTQSISWLGLHRYPRSKVLEKERFTPNECFYAKYRYGLGKKQLEFCHHPEGSFAMHAVLKSAQAVTYYCPEIFKDRRWNCSSVELLPKTSPDISRTTREKAAMHALASAALMFEIGRRCAENKIMDCECGRLDNWDIPLQPADIDDPGPVDLKQSQNVPLQYHWGGCSDNFEAAKTYTHAFLGFPAETRPQRRQMRYVLHPYGRYSRVPRQTVRQMNKKRNSKKKTKRLVNLHNYRAGMKIIEDSQKIRCKCQGVSGSCAHKICFRQLLRIDSSQLQDIILQRYMMARYVSVDYGSLLIAKEYEYGSYTPRVIHYSELAFTEHSPDFCEPDAQLGSVGTKGRFCSTNVTERAQSNHCQNMCCGRGHVTFEETKFTNCNCRITKDFRVICDKCPQVVTRNICK